MTLNISLLSSEMDQIGRVNEPDFPHYKYEHSCLHTVYATEIETAWFAPVCPACI